MNKQILWISLLTFLFACNQQEPTDLTKTALIPKPVSVTANGEAFIITAKTTVYVQASDELSKVGQYFIDMLKPATGFSLSLKTDSPPPAKGIWLGLTDDTQLGTEGYRLMVSKNLISLQANTPEGVFRGLQTVRQMLPPEIEANTIQQMKWIIPGGEIIDYPEYVFRSSMLDVSRHFFSVEDVKHYIDLLTAYKMNFFHIHLSDDQGWRIEIKSWPKLTEIGSKTQVGGGQGGFYTQEQYKDIVNYAAERYITVVPEIDMPGHTNAALASYPELNRDGKARELYTGIEVGFSTLCTDKEITYKFVDDVIREVAALTPGDYIHIGGDESHATKKNDYITFINKVQDIVISHGKVMIGWDEITHADLSDLAVAQYWSSAENAKRAVDKGVPLIISPAKKAYIDMKYDSLTTLGLKWAGYIEVQTGYDWDPVTLEEEISRENILGIEAPLWTENIASRSDFQYMVMPRLPGYAEIAWTTTGSRNWDEYKVRLAEHGKRFKIAGINYYPSKQIPWSN